MIYHEFAVRRWDWEQILKVKKEFCESFHYLSPCTNKFSQLKRYLFVFFESSSFTNICFINTNKTKSWFVLRKKESSSVLKKLTSAFIKLYSDLFLHFTQFYQESRKLLIVVQILISFKNRNLEEKRNKIVVVPFLEK